MRTYINLLVVCLSLFCSTKEVIGRQQTQAPAVRGADDESGNEIRDREKFFYTRRAGGPGKTVPDDAYANAVAGAFPLLSKDRSVSRSVSSALPGWVSVNPSGMFYQRTGGNYIAGRTNSIAYHPSDLNTLYLGAAGGGVWKTTNAGVSWTPLTDYLSALTCGAVAVDPNNSSVVYVGTGELNYSLDSYYGDGVFKSSDGGASWIKVATTSVGRYISQIVIDPTNSNNVYLTGSFGVYRSTDAGMNWGITGSGSNSNCLLLDPANPQVLFTTRGGTSTNSIRKSTNGGGSWTTLTNGLPIASMGRTQLAMAPSNSNIIYASISNKSNDNLLGVYRTTDGGSTWTLQASTPNYLGSQGWYDNAITVSPANSNVIFVGGLDIYRSGDGGVTFTQKTVWYTTSSTNMSHADIHFLGFVGSTLYCGSDGGVYKSDVNGDTWLDLNATLSTLQFQSADYDPTNTQRLYGGTQDNNLETSSNGGTLWIQRTTGDGGYSVVDPISTNIVYGQYVNGSLKRSTDFGVNFTEISPSGSGLGLFYNPYEIAPGDHNTIVFGRGDIWKTTSATTATSGSGWTQIRGNVIGNVSAIGISSIDAGKIYIGTDNGKILITTDNGTSWTDKTGFPYVSDLAVDEGDDAICYASCGGFGSTHIYKTTNSGSTWVNISGNYPNIPVNSIVLRTAPPRMIFIGTDVGAYRSTNEGVTWSSFNNGLPAVEVFDLKYKEANKLLLAATHGRGCFTYDLTNFTLGIAPRTLGFGNVFVGSNKIDSVTVSNFGASAVNFSSVSSDRAEFSVSPSSANIAPSSSQTFYISFTPTPTGNTSGNVIFASDAVTSPDTVRVSGYGGVGTVTAVKLNDTDGDSTTIADRVLKRWHLIVYQDSVSPGTLLSAKDSTQLPVFVPKTGTYIIAEADSGIPWIRVNGNRTRFDTITVQNGVSLFDTLVNTRFSVSTTVAAGWNMISNPVVVQNNAVAVIFPTSTLLPFYYLPGFGYVATSTLLNGTGYWLKFPANHTEMLSGQIITSLAMNVGVGWNLIGSITTPVPTASIVQSPPNIVHSAYFTFDLGYHPSDTMNPGKAYWVKTDQVGQLIVNATGIPFTNSSGKTISEMLPGLNSITITDQKKNSQTLYFGAMNEKVSSPELFDMPPQPVGEFDVRFTSNKFVELYSPRGDATQEYLLRAVSTEYPLTVHWKLAVGSTEQITLGDDRGTSFTISLKDVEGSYTVRDHNTHIFKLTIHPASIPTEFALQQNYPNPFNPITTLRYELPVQSNVVLKIYNTIGEEIKTLVKEQQEPGYRTVRWDGTDNEQHQAASGVYFYRIQATGAAEPSKSFVQVRKMLLVK